MSELNEQVVFDKHIRQDSPSESEGVKSSKRSQDALEHVELIQRMVREASLEPSAVAAALQINGSDLLEMSLAMKPPIIEAVKNCGSTTDFKELLPLIDTYVKVSRQADRMLRLKQEISQSVASEEPDEQRGKERVKRIF